ncbi:MAG: DNA replication protein [Pseudomonadota bacterium]
MTDASDAEQGGARQPRLSFGDPPADFRRQAFVAVDAAADALSFADAWIKSDAGFLAICGPDGSGKTHLGRILCAEFGEPGADADCLTASAPVDVVALLDKGARFVFVDDAHCAPKPQDLVDFLIAAAAAGLRVAVAGAGAPADWARGLKDLETRLEAMPRVTMAPPGEALLQALIAKLFQDRQLDVSADVVRYAAERLPRRFDAARAFVAAADGMANERQGPVTKALARQAIEALAEAPTGGDAPGVNS